MSSLTLWASEQSQARFDDEPAAIELHGQLDDEAVSALCERLRGLGRPAVVDFSTLRHVSDSALGVFAEWLDERRLERRVRLVGLDAHTERVLRAFGLGADTATTELGDWQFAG